MRWVRSAACIVGFHRYRIIAVSKRLDRVVAVCTRSDRCRGRRFHFEHGRLR